MGSIELHRNGNEWIPNKEKRFSTLDKGLIGTRNDDEIASRGSMARQEQQRDRGTKMTNGGNSARNVDTGGGERPRRVVGTMTVAARSGEGRVEF